jgi:hypothetical protein
MFFLDVIMKPSNIILATNYPSLDRTRRNSKFKLCLGYDCQVYFESLKMKIISQPGDASFYSI